MPEAEGRLLWQRLRRETGIEPVGVRRPALLRRIPVRRFVAASVFALALAGGIRLATRKQGGVTHDITREAVVVTPSQQQVIISNPGRRHKKVKLEDGSEVLLAEHASINYTSSFDSDRRNIFLKGEAFFRVAKGKRRPFTVYCGDISTTALGTVFLVSMDSSSRSVNVRLFQGRVVVRPAMSSAATYNFVFSSVGYQTAYLNGLKVSSDRNSSILMTLKLTHSLMGDVVVTALGVTTKRKAIGYSIQEVKGSALTEARETNFVNSLEGRVAGVNVVGGSNSIGGSARIVIRKTEVVALIFSRGYRPPMRRASGLFTR